MKYKERFMMILGSEQKKYYLTFGIIKIDELIIKIPA